MASGDSPSNAAIAAMGGGGGGGVARRYSTLKWGGGVGRRWPGDILFIKYCWKAPFWSLIFLQKHMLNIGCNTPRWDLC